MARGGTFAAIDVGTTKVCTVVAEYTPEGHVRVLGVGISTSAGMHKGSVDNIHEATVAIADSVQRAERASGMRILSAYVSIAGAHIQATNNRGVVAIPGRQRPITQDDIDRALETAHNIDLPANRQVLHVLPRYYILDGQDRVRNPLGMYAQRLDVEAHVITGSLSAVQNLSKCVEGAGVQVDKLVLSSLASAQAVLEEEEKRQGAVLVDIGGGTSDIAIFVDGGVYHTAILPVGGYHLTHDLVAGLRAPYSAAEAAKTLHAHAIPSTINPDDMVEIEAFGHERRKAVSRRRLCEIVQARTEEILELIFMEVRRAGYDERISAGMVITGGCARLPGIDILAEEVLRMPVRVGAPRGLYGLSDTLSSPAYATSVGLIQWAIRDSELGPRFAYNGLALPLRSWLRRVGDWFRVLLPQ